MKKDSDIIGLICARGGSKGIPHKNIRMLHGKPLLGWTIEAAKQSGSIDRIVVSTDSPSIAEVAVTYGAEVPGLRPARLAKDTSDQFDTHAYIFDKLKLTDENSRIAILVNNPFLTSNLITKMIDTAKTTNFEKLVTTAIQTRYPYYFQFMCKDDICYPLFKNEFLQMPINRQERETMYFPFFLGCIGRPSMLRGWEDYKLNMVNGFIPVIISKQETFDLDDEDDWRIAETVFSLNKNDG